MGTKRSHVEALLESGSAEDAMSLAADAVLAERKNGGPRLLSALALFATAARQAGRTEEARGSYAELAQGFGARDDNESQLRAAVAEIWLARLADDAVLTRRYFEQARDRRLRAEDRWGPSDWSAIICMEVAGELAALALTRGDPAAALGELRRGPATASAAIARPQPDQDLLATACSAAGLMQASQLGGTASILLQRLAEYYREAGDVPRAATAYQALGDLLRQDGSERRALSAYFSGVDVLGADPAGRDAALTLAAMLNRAGLAADRLGEYALSAATYERALRIRRRLLQPGDYDLLLSRYNVAEIARITGETDFAARELRAVADTLRGQDTDASARLLRLALKNLAQSLIKIGRPQEAEEAIAQAMSPGDLEEQMQGNMLVILGQARAAQGRPQGVATELSRLAEAMAARTGKQSLSYLNLLLSVAWALPADRAAEIEQIYATVIGELGDATDLETRMLVAQTRCNLAAVRWAHGDLDGAFDAFAAAVPAAEESYAELWRVRSAFETASRESPLMTAPALQLVARHLAGRDDARRLAFRLGLSGKRRQAEALASQRALVLQGRTELLGLQKLAADLRRSAAWTLDDLPDHVDDLARLEGVLAREVPREALLETTRQSGADEIAAALPAGSVLVEYIWCPAFTAKDLGLDSEGARYIAFVLPAGQPECLAIIDLGGTDRIDAAVQALQGAIGQGRQPAGHWQDCARSLATLVWDPVAARLPDTPDIFVAPDSGLCAIPFDALIGPDGKPLLETRTFTVLATGRDAHRMQTRANWRTREPVVIAAPDFGEPWEPFGPLPGSIDEGSAVADLLNVDPITAEEATRNVVLELDNPEILHLATHGYYLRPAAHEGLAARIAAAAATHPLVSSGVALASANRMEDGEEPGVVSALDILGLQLAGTDLVVLSACESGLGPLDTAEGLLGLARSFVLAGARSVVWTRWRIDDAATALVIEDMYQRLLAETPRAHALAGAKRAAYARLPERVEVWAAFVLQGDPGELLRFRFADVPEKQIYTDQPHTEGNLHMLDTRGRPVSAFEVSVGEGKPLKVASVSMRNLGVSLAEDDLAKGQRALEAGDNDEAREHFTNGLAILAGLPAGRRIAASLHDRLAVVAGMAGDLETGRTHGLAALDLLEGMDGADGLLSVVLDNLGITEFNLGDGERGRGRLERALGIKRSMMPANEPQITFTEGILAQMRQTGTP